MSILTIPTSPEIFYPDNDGKPMAEGTLQFYWIVMITEGLSDLFAGDPNVFVAGDLFWYPVQGSPRINAAPDSMVAFGRPKGHRGSYRQWVEGGIAPQVVFEVLSPSNRPDEMSDKFDFYQQYGPEEYYVYDPGYDTGIGRLSGYLRRQGNLIEIPNVNGHVSPRLKVTFEMDDQGLRIVRPDGQPFVTLTEAQVQKREAEAQLRETEARQREAEDKLRSTLQQLELEQARAKATREQLQAELDRLRSEAGPHQIGD